MLAPLANQCPLCARSGVVQCVARKLGIGVSVVQRVVSGGAK